MNFFGFEIRRRQKKEPVDSFINARRFGSSGKKSAMALAAVYRCVNVISESVAQLPLETFHKDADGYKSLYVRHPAYNLLREFPSPDMTRFTFLKTLVSSVLLQGNGYAYIDRDEYGNALSLQYIPSSDVNIVYLNIDGVLRMRYQVTGFKYLVEPIDMIHVLNFSYDGITGVSTLTHARNTLSISASAEEFAKDFFSEGGNVRGILSFDNKLRDGQKEEIKKAWAEMIAKGGVGVLEANSHYQSISINPSDAQMIETREFNVIDICRFFGVSRSGYYDFVKRLGQPEKDAVLAEKLRAQQAHCFQTYGYRRMHLWLENQGIHYNPKTILRIMKKYGILSEIRRKRKWQNLGKMLISSILNRLFQITRHLVLLLSI